VLTKIFSRENERNLWFHITGSFSSARIDTDIAVTTAIGCCFGGLRIGPNPKVGRCRCKLLPEEECSKENPIRDVPARKYSDSDPGDPFPAGSVSADRSFEETAER
jgi:hypothetical protein